MVFLGHFWSLIGKFCLIIAKYNLKWLALALRPTLEHIFIIVMFIWAKLNATRVHWNGQN